MDFTIPGINKDIGLALYNNDEDIYLAVLRSFVPNAIKTIEKLGSFSRDNLPDYIINIHGLKGISAGIGAEKIREGAMELETEAKAGNVSGIAAKNEGLLKEVRILTSDIQSWLGNLDKQNPRPLLKCPDRNLLAKLRKSLESYDMKGIDDVMDQLESADYKNKKDASLIVWLREKIKEMELSSAASRLSAYEEEST